MKVTIYSTDRSQAIYSIAEQVLLKKHIIQQRLTLCLLGFCTVQRNMTRYFN